MCTTSNIIIYTYVPTYLNSRAKYEVTSAPTSSPKKSDADNEEYTVMQDIEENPKNSEITESEYAYVTTIRYAARKSNKSDMKKIQSSNAAKKSRTDNDELAEDEADEDNGYVSTLPPKGLQDRMPKTLQVSEMEMTSISKEKDLTASDTTLSQNPPAEVLPAGRSQVELDDDCIYAQPGINSAPAQPSAEDSEYYNITTKFSIKD